METTLHWLPITDATILLQTNPPYPRPLEAERRQCSVMLTDLQLYLHQARARKREATFSTSHLPHCQSIMVERVHQKLDAAHGEGVVMADEYHKELSSHLSVPPLTETRQWVALNLAPLVSCVVELESLRTSQL